MAYLAHYGRDHRDDGLKRPRFGGDIAGMERESKWLLAERHNSHGYDLAARLDLMAQVVKDLADANESLRDDVKTLALDNRSLRADVEKLESRLGQLEGIVDVAWPASSVNSEASDSDDDDEEDDGDGQ